MTYSILLDPSGTSVHQHPVVWSLVHVTNHMILIPATNSLLSVRASVAMACRAGLLSPLVLWVLCSRGSVICLLGLDCPIIVSQDLSHGQVPLRLLDVTTPWTAPPPPFLWLCLHSQGSFTLGADCLLPSCQCALYQYVVMLLPHLVFLIPRGG